MTLYEFAELQLHCGGTLVPASLAHRLLGVSRTRLGQYLETGVLRRVSVEGWQMVPMLDLVNLHKARSLPALEKRLEYSRLRVANHKSLPPAPTPPARKRGGVGPGPILVNPLNH